MRGGPARRAGASLGAPLSAGLPSGQGRRSPRVRQTKRVGPTVGAGSPFPAQAAKRRRGHPVAKRKLRTEAELPSGEALALHEIVGWLLGATFAKYCPARVEEVPTLLVEHPGEELELLRSILQGHIGEDGADAYGELLYELRSFCDSGLPNGGHEDKGTVGLDSVAAAPLSAEAFLSQVLDIIRQRGLWHSTAGASTGAEGVGSTQKRSRRAPRGNAEVDINPGATSSTQRLPLTADPPAKCEGREGTDIRSFFKKASPPAEGREGMDIRSFFKKASPPAQLLHGVTPDRRESQGSSAVDGLGAASAEKVGLTRAVAVNLEAEKQCQEKRQEKKEAVAVEEEEDEKVAVAVEEEEWPEGNGTCEGCGRLTYGCEAWSTEGVILCGACRKARAPLMWALTQEVFRVQSAMSGARMGGA